MAEEVLSSTLGPEDEAKEIARVPHEVAHLGQDDVIERALILPECKPRRVD